MAKIGRVQQGGEIFFVRQVDDDWFRLRGDVFGAPVPARRPLSQRGLKLLPPVPAGKVIAVGLNYAAHIAEMRRERPREPLFWFKANTSLLPHGGKIRIPFPGHRTDFEAELAVVIGRKLCNPTAAQAARGILGYTAAQDISDRTIQKAESQWARCKSFDTFTPLGPWIETDLDVTALRLQLFQNGKLRQDASTRDLVFRPVELVRFIATHLTLLPGDVILTGTPAGVGPIRPGDRLEVRIEGLAPLVNTVA